MDDRTRLTRAETAGKTIEEVEEMWRPGAIKPWKTKPGNSHLDQRLGSVSAGQRDLQPGEKMLAPDGTIQTLEKRDEKDDKDEGEISN